MDDKDNVLYFLALLAWKALSIKIFTFLCTDLSLAHGSEPNTCSANVILKVLLNEFGR